MNNSRAFMTDQFSAGRPFQANVFPNGTVIADIIAGVVSGLVEARQLP
jgi:hypothetical protein